MIHAEEEIMRMKLVAYKDIDSSPISFVTASIGSIFKNPIFLIIFFLLLIALAILVYKNILKRKRIKRQKARIAATQKGEQPRARNYDNKFTFKDDNNQL